MTSSGSTLLFGAIPTALKPTAVEKRALRQFADLLSEQLGDSRPFVCLLADDAQLKRLNFDFLGHAYATDVLSFPNEKGDRLLCPDKGSLQTADASLRRTELSVPFFSRALGEIAISMERAATQAAEYDHSCVEEVRILMLHGVLHLTGLDHANGDTSMGRAEKRWRKEFNLPETLIARARNAKRGNARRQTMQKLVSALGSTLDTATVLRVFPREGAA